MNPKDPSRRDLLTFWRRKGPAQAEAPGAATGARPGAEMGPRPAAGTGTPGGPMPGGPLHGLMPGPPGNPLHGPLPGMPGGPLHGLMPGDPGATGPATQQPVAPPPLRARLLWETCLAYHNTPCDACHRTCPVDRAIRIDDHGHPRLDRYLCNGCGDCLPVCPTRPPSLVMAPLV